MDNERKFHLPIRCIYRSIYSQYRRDDGQKPEVQPVVSLFQNEKTKGLLAYSFPSRIFWKKKRDMKPDRKHCLEWVKCFEISPYPLTNWLVIPAHHLKQQRNAWNFKFFGPRPLAIAVERRPKGGRRDSPQSSMEDVVYWASVDILFLGIIQHPSIPLSVLKLI